jgi:ABC-type siderophore export system fused ATPase/permease subunit
MDGDLMPEWVAEALKQGGLFAVACLAIWFALFVFREYVKLNAVIVELAKADAVSDTKLLGSMTQLIDAIKEANTERRRGSDR